MPKVLILMGSDSDAEVMKHAKEQLVKLGVEVKMTVASAHRTPDRVKALVHQAETDGARVFIAGAGGAAHLAGSVAALTTRPVIGVPINSSEMNNGLDALLSTAQMPPGIPVATVAVGKQGAINAGILAAQILGVADENTAQQVKENRAAMAEKVLEKAKKVEQL